MSGILDRCVCTPNARVFVASGQVYCTRCLAARSLLPLSKQDKSLGVLGLFYAPKEPISWTCPQGWPTPECSPAGCCWLAAIFPIARMTSGNGNFQQRMEHVAQVIYSTSKQNPHVLNRLQVYDRGCDWFPIVGPVPGVAVYANSMHVSDTPFPGATHVLTNLPLPQRPKRQPFCPFEEAHANVWSFGQYVVYETEDKWSWAPRGDYKQHHEPVPFHLRQKAEFVTKNFPPHHIVTLTHYKPLKPGRSGVSYRVENQEGDLSPEEIPDGTCWQACFYGLPEDAFERELRMAVQLGYQSKHGVPGKYIQRRLQVNGLRAVIDPKGLLQVQAFSTPTSWIRHIHVDEVDPPSGPDFVEICRIRVEPNTSPLAPGEKIFRFGAHKWYGKGKNTRQRLRAMEEPTSERPLSPRQMAQVKMHEMIGLHKSQHILTYSPPGDGNCGWHCLSAVVNRMIANVLESSLPSVTRPSDDWATDDDLARAIEVLGLPIGVYRHGHCPDAKYVLKLERDHWTVTCTPKMTPKRLPPECIQGVCHHIGSQIGGTPPPVKIRPDYGKLLQHVMHLPSAVIPDALKGLLTPAEPRDLTPQDMTPPDVTPMDLTPTPEPTAEVYTTAQIMARKDMTGFKELATQIELAFSLFGMVGCSEGEVSAAVDATLADCSSLDECRGALAKCLRDVSVTKRGFSLKNYFPCYEPATVCTAVVPVPTSKQIEREVHPLDLAMSGKTRSEKVDIPCTIENVMNFTYPDCHDTHWEVTRVCRSITNCLRDKHGYGFDTLTRCYPTMPEGLEKICEQAEEDFLRIVGAQTSLELMQWVAKEFEIAPHCAKYNWTPPAKEPTRKFSKQRRVCRPVAPPPPPPSGKVAESTEVPDSWETLADDPIDLSQTSSGRLSDLQFGAPSIHSDSVFLPAPASPDDAPLDLSVKGSVKFGPPSSQNSVCLDRPAVVEELRLDEVPLDLSGSSVTEFDCTHACETASVSSSSSDGKVEIIRRPPKSAQALIDAGDELASHLLNVKTRAIRMCKEACDPTTLEHPKTVAWINAMWDKVDHLTWRNTSKFQAMYQLAPLQDFLPRMILETPPPFPCPIMLPLGSPPRSRTPSVDLTIRSNVSTPPPPEEPADDFRKENKMLAEFLCDIDLASPQPATPQDPLEQPALADKKEERKQATPSPEDSGGEPPTLWSRAGAVCGKAVDGLCGKVFEVTSHLPAFMARAFYSSGNYTAGDWAFAGFVLCCLLLCYSWPAFGCLSLLGVFTGSGRRVRMAVFGCWLAFAILLFRPEQDPVAAHCDSDTPECRRVLLDFEHQQPWNPVRGLILGPVGLTLAIFGRLLGGSRIIWLVLLRVGFVADVVLAGGYIIGQGRCKKCWGRCVRTAPSEIAFNVFPFTRATRQSLVDLCNRFTTPSGIDPIFLATGWRGCYTGGSPIEQHTSKPITYCNLDEKKVTAATVVVQPLDPNQAVKCLKVLQAGGAMCATKVPEVIKVSTVPFLAPFLPKVPVDPNVKIVVDPDTFTCAIRSGYDTSNLILGEGDFAKENGLPVQQMQKPRGGATTYLTAVIQVAVWMVCHMVVGIYITAVDQCGTGTHDPWCSNPFSVPVFGSGTLCTTQLCISPHGLALPLSTVLKDFGAREAGFVCLILASLAVIAHKLAVKADVFLVLCSLICYVHPLLAWVAACFPLCLTWLSVHPLTIVWVCFFLVTCNPPAGFLAMVFLLILWVLGRYTQVAGIVTPYDIHSHTNGPRGAAALMNASDGTYLAAVRKAALTGRTMMFCPSNLGSLLEGAFRTQKPCSNTVNVVGSSMGSGGVFTYKGKKVCITAAHVLSGNSARVTGPGFNRMLQFETHGDFAIAPCEDWVGQAPETKDVPKGWTGRAFWLTATGVEPGVMGKGFAFCFTACGDSGSPVLTEAGDLIGIHTGSNKQGGGIVTSPDGTTCNIQDVALSELSKYFAGPLVPLGDLKVGQHIIVDTHQLPSDLCALLAAKPTLEGGLSTVQLLCVFFLLWRMMGYIYTPFIAVLFFCLNEVLPAVLCRSVFSFGITAIAWLSPWSAQVLMIRLLTAALNRNRLSLLFYTLGAVAGFVSEVAVHGGHMTNFSLITSTYLFVPRWIVFETPVPLIVAFVIHVVAVILWLFKYRLLHNVLVGDGAFSAAFFLRYFAEGKLREGVSQSCGMNHESLTGALACKLNDDDLAFLTKLTDFKCFVSATNMRNAAQQYIEAAYAKALRIELSQLVQVDKMRGVLAKLEAFADTTTPSLSVGDVVVLLGNTPVGCMFETMVGSVKHTVQVIETRTLAGTKMTVCKVVEPQPYVPDKKIALPVPVEALESDNRAEDAEWQMAKKKGRQWQKVSEHVMDGTVYHKMWDKKSGDTFYIAASDQDDRYNDIEVGRAGGHTFARGAGGFEGAGVDGHPNYSRLRILRTKWIGGEEIASCRDMDTGTVWSIPMSELPGSVRWGTTMKETPLEAAKLNIEQALTSMGAGTELTAQEVEKLKRIIEQLQGLTREQTLNC
ncbi:replicase protein 1a [Arteriviridae sp.]|nr:replicase protein 1a [Arteriviridae sp.]